MLLNADVASANLSISDIIQIFGILVSLTISVGALLYTVKWNRDIEKKNEIRIKDSTRPLVYIHIKQLHTGRYSWYLMIKNSGGSPARIINVTLNKENFYSSDASKPGHFDHDFNVPNDAFSRFLCSTTNMVVGINDVIGTPVYADLYRDKSLKVTNDLKITVNYSSLSGEKYSDTYDVVLNEGKIDFSPGNVKPDEWNKMSLEYLAGLSKDLQR